MTGQKTASLQAPQSTIMLGVMILLVGIMCISSSSAQQFVFKQNSNIDLKITCLDNNQSFCSADTLCNITINYPNGTNAVNNGVMTRQASYFNYTLASSAATGLGTYTATTLCSGLTNGAATFTFDVTQTGSSITIADMIGYSAAVLILFVIFVFSLIGAIIIPYKNNVNDDGRIISINDFKYFKIGCIAACYVLALFIFNLMQGITARLLQFDMISGFFNAGYFLMLSFMLPVIVITLIVVIINFITDKKLSKALARGFRQ